MSHDPTQDVINRQYERWTYPEPIHDLPAWLETNWQWFDPSHAHPILWPDGSYRPDIDILIAGCGTNQAAMFAYTNPDARVVGVDISQSSLQHQQHLKDTYRLTNLELHRLPIEDLSSLGRQFDLVVSTGVLMVMADPLAGMKALGQCVRRDGAVAIMVYAKHGRNGVSLLQSVFRDLGLGQDEESVRMVRLALASLGPGHPVRSYFAIAPDLTHDTGLVDTFLIQRESTYTVDECLALVTDAGLVFQSWLLNAPYYAHGCCEPDNAFIAAVEALESAKQWSVMDRYGATNGCHFFIACRPDRPRERYVVDFSSPEALDYIPVFRFRCGVRGEVIARPDLELPLSADQARLLQELDGSRSIREIATRSGVATHDDARRFLEALWKLDIVAALLPRAGSVPPN